MKNSDSFINFIIPDLEYFQDFGWFTHVATKPIAPECG